MTATSGQPPTLETPPKDARSRNRGNQPGRLSPYSQAVKLQDLCLEAAQKPDATASALAALAKSWNELEDRKRILRGRALPVHEPLSKVARNGRRSQSSPLIETDGRFAEATPMPAQASAQAQEPVSESPSTPKPAAETPTTEKQGKSHGK